MPVPPKKPKPQKVTAKLPPSHHARPLEQETAGKLYLVRDKDYGDGQPVLWGTSMPYGAACQLKEKVAGRRLSMTVRVEEMTPDNAHYLALPIDPRSPFESVHVPATIMTQPPAQPVYTDPAIVAAQEAAKRASAPIAAAANQRQAQPPKVVIPPAALKPPVMPELPPELDGEDGEDLPAVDQDELDKLLHAGDLPDAEDVEAAAAEVGERPAPVNVLELAMKFTCPTCGAVEGIACTDPSGPITHSARIMLAAPPGVAPGLEALGG